MKTIQHSFTSSAFWLFLAGLGSITEVHFIGSVAITELFFFAIAPVAFIMNFHQLKHDGFMPWIWLTILTCVGCVVASKVNNVYWVFMLKGLATSAVYFSATVLFHRLLKNGLADMKWFLIGSFMSSIISVFVFQQETFTVSGGFTGSVATGVAAVEAVTGYALFWSSRINAFLTLSVKCFYFKTPSLYTCCVPIICAIVSMAFSDGSGRAAAAVGVASAILLFFGRKSRRNMRVLGKNLWLLLLAGILVGALFKTTYSYCAKRGLLGDAALKKYEKQTAMGTGIIDILMAGRMELFCGLQACVDYPIIGLGPKAPDRNGYTEKYLTKYGSVEDFEQFMASQLSARREGFTEMLVPVHSCLVYFWLYCGISGLLMCLYVLWLMYKYLRKYSTAIPQWYGYICLSIPVTAWDIFFSPPGGRLQFAFLVVCLLMCKGVSQHRVSLPFKMEIEAQRES